MPATRPAGLAIAHSNTLYNIALQMSTPQLIALTPMTSLGLGKPCCCCKRHVQLCAAAAVAANVVALLGRVLHPVEDAGTCRYILSADGLGGLKGHTRMSRTVGTCWVMWWWSRFWLA